MKSTILLIIVLIVLLWNSREGFTKDANINTFLNTWHTTNDELKKIVTPFSNRIQFKKELEIINPVSDGNPVKHGTHFNFHMNANNYIRGNHTFIDSPFTTSKDSLINGTNFIQNWSGNSTKTMSQIANDTKGQKKLMIVGNSSSGTRKVGIWDQLDVHGNFCIGNTCINENHLKALRGERDVYLGLEKGVIDCGKYNNTCYASGNRKNSNTKFRIKHNV